MEKSDNREKILVASIELFNNQKSSNVSTVQICKEAGISTGNLYYHFNNKEHIIRTLWEEQICPRLNSAIDPESFGKSENGIIHGFEKLAKTIYKYRFFYSELPTLVSNDELLKRSYQERHIQTTQALFKITHLWSRVGIMQPIDDSQRRFLSELGWYITQTWMPFEEILNTEISYQTFVKNTFFHVYGILKPYFTDSANERFQKLIELVNCGE